jgi:ABC-type cobalamin/Fe3+-siderophores transport system ATPase subunit
LSVILGPNGAGKSTLLACLSGLLKFDNCSAMLGDDPIADMRAENRAKAIGLLPQGAETHWAITAGALVALGRYPHRKGFGLSVADRTAIAAALAATGTAEFAARRVTELSGGERARVLMARVLAGEPQWILADEPLANLDPGYQLDMLTLLRAQADVGKGVIAVLHDLHHAVRFADHVSGGRNNYQRPYSADLGSRDWAV